MTVSLFSAIAQQDVALIERLLQAGAEPNILDPCQGGPLHAVLREPSCRESLDIVALLLNAGADVNAVLHAGPDTSWPLREGDTPLLLACDPPNFATVDLLIRHGANTNARRGDGESPLRLCVQARDLKVARLLLENGATRTMNEYGGGGGLGWTALSYAADNFDIPMIELLLEKGADPFVREEFGEIARDHLPPREEHDPQQWDEVAELLGRRRERRA